MKRLALGSVLLAAVLLGGNSLLRSADSPRPANDETHVRSLVRQLGADNYDDREQAYQELSRLGRQAEKALQEGLKDSDREVVRRCQELLSLATRTDMEIALDLFLQNKDEKALLKLPAWPAFSKLVGESPETRALFVQICCSQGPLLDLAEKNPQDAAVKFGERTQQLQQVLFQPFAARGNVSSTEVLALLYLATNPKLNINQQALFQLCSLFHQPEPRQLFTNDSTARKLLANFVMARTDQAMVHQNLFLVQNFNLKECLDWSLNLATAKDQQPYVRATAMTVVGKMGAKEHIAKLEPLLSDTTQLGQIQFNTTRINTQVRDVALAMSILLSGQDIQTYDFPYLKVIQAQMQQNPQAFLYSYHYLGFSDDTGRNAAMKKWNESSKGAKK
jgi:HEAT repeat protein